MKRKYIVVVICLFVLGAIFFCNREVKVKADISSYSDRSIEIVGLTKNKFIITPQILAALPCVKQTVTAESAKVGTVTAVGPLLDTFLEQYGRNQTDFTKIRISAEDGYKTILKNDLLKDKIILSVAAGNKPLDEKFQPLRIIIPGAASSFWTYKVKRIEFVKD